MKKTIALVFLAVLMLMQCACGVVPPKDGNTASVASDITDGSELTALTASAVTKQIKPAAAIYLRGGTNGDYTYEDLSKEYRAGSDKELILKRNTKEGNSNNDREIYLQYDLSEVLLNVDAFKHAYLSFSGTSRDEDIGDVLVYVMDEEVDLSKLTFNTRPEGELVLDNFRINSFTPVDIQACVDYALDFGLDVMTLRLVGKNTSKGEFRFSGAVQNLPTLTVTGDVRDGSVAYAVFETAEENEALWAYAEQMYNEWYARHQQMVAEAKNDPEVPLIRSDEDQFNKTVTWAEHIGWNDRYEKTRTFDALDDLGDYVDITEEQIYDRYGGLMDPDMKQEATGFFYAKEIDGRWWIIDPLGYPCHIRSVSGITIQYSPDSGQGNAAKAMYGTTEKWAIATVRRLMDGLYFNACTKSTTVAAVEDSMIQVVSLGGFASGYGSQIGVNASVGGSTKFTENNTMPIFDPAFAEYSDAKAKEAVAEYKDNETILGFYTDNELPMGEDMLLNYLTVDGSKKINDVYVNAYSYACAWTFLMKQTGKERPTEADVTAEIADLFRGFVWDRYFYVTCNAVRTYDSDHMLMGTKFLRGVLEAEWVCRAAGEYLDCLAINWYNAWEPEAELLQKLGEYTRLPFIVTEFYAKAVECEGNLAHTDAGAGFLVKTQTDRGYFYQNFTLRLLESTYSVGWQWFQYIDCDPSGSQTDVSSIDSNKGIFSNTHKEYTDLTVEMIEINKNVYHLMDYFDQKYAD